MEQRWHLSEERISQVNARACFLTACSVQMKGILGVGNV